MRRVLRGLVLRHRESQRGHVNIDKQCLTLTEGNWCKCKVEGIDKPSLQFILGCGEQKLIRSIGISKNNLAHVLGRLEL